MIGRIVAAVDVWRCAISALEAYANEHNIQLVLARVTDGPLNIKKRG